MDASLLKTILDAAPGIEREGDEVRTTQQHRVSLYLGSGGGTTVLADLVRVRFHDAYLEAEAKDGTHHYTLYEPIIGTSVRGARDDRGGRTGF